MWHLNIAYIFKETLDNVTTSLNMLNTITFCHYRIGVYLHKGKYTSQRISAKEILFGCLASLYCTLSLYWNKCIIMPCLWHKNSSLSVRNANNILQMTNILICKCAKVGRRVLLFLHPNAIDIITNIRTSHMFFLKHVLNFFG